MIFYETSKILYLAKSSNKNLSKANTQCNSLVNKNSYSNNTNSCNNAHMLNNQNFSINNISNNYNNSIKNNIEINYNKANESINPEKEQIDVQSNFSDVIISDEINSNNNRLAKSIMQKQSYITNPYSHYNMNDKIQKELFKKSSNTLEVKDLDVNENLISLNRNSYNNKSSTIQTQNKSSFNSDNNMNKDTINHNCNNPYFLNASDNISNSDTIYEKLKMIKNRTKEILSLYADSFINRKISND